MVVFLEQGRLTPRIRRHTPSTSSDIFALTPQQPHFTLKLDMGAQIALRSDQATLAQLVEHSFRKAGVQGSSP